MNPSHYTLHSHAHEDSWYLSRYPVLYCTCLCLFLCLCYIALYVHSLSHQQKRYSHLVQDGGRGISRWLYVGRLNQSWHVSLLHKCGGFGKPNFLGLATTLETIPDIAKVVGDIPMSLQCTKTHSAVTPIIQCCTHTKIIGVTALCYTTISCWDAMLLYISYTKTYTCIYAYTCFMLYYICIPSHDSGSGIHLLQDGGWRIP